MQRVPVTSSLLASVGYDPNDNTLEVEFRNGSVYVYFRVPKSVFDKLLTAPSKGRYFTRSIKDVFPYRRVV